MDPYHLLTIPYLLSMPPAFASSSPSCSAFILILDSALDGEAGRGLEVPKLLKKFPKSFQCFLGKPCVFHIYVNLPKLIMWRIPHNSHQLLNSQPRSSLDADDFMLFLCRLHTLTLSSSRSLQQTCIWLHVGLWLSLSWYLRAGM